MKWKERKRMCTETREQRHRKRTARKEWNDNKGTDSIRKYKGRERGIVRKVKAKTGMDAKGKKV